MFLSPRSVIIGLSSLLVPISASAAPLCEYAAFSVPALHQNIFEALSRRGFAIAPAAYFSNEPTSDVSAQEPNANPLANEFWVLEDGQLFAKLNFNQNAVEATSELRITGPEGDFLAEAKSTVLPCSGGWCRETKLTTARDSASDSVDGAQGLIISQEPSYGMKYYVYGERVGVTPAGATSLMIATNGFWPF